jgi:hypothetical protein
MFALVWLQRDRIADHYVQRSLAAKHVRASYRITQVALRTQRIENLVLGDPARPDLVAQSVEVDIGYGLGLPYVANVRVRGARLRGRLDAAGLHLGELDKFRDTRLYGALSPPGYRPDAGRCRSADRDAAGACWPDGERIGQSAIGLCGQDRRADA